MENKTNTPEELLNAINAEKQQRSTPNNLVPMDKKTDYNSYLVNLKNVEIVPRNHIVDNFLTSKMITLLSAPRGTGKTTFIAEFATALETCGTFFGDKFTVKQKQKVLIVLSEGDAQDIKEKTVLINENIEPLILFTKQMGLDRVKILETIEYAIKVHGITVVLYDSFSLMSSRETKDANATNDAIQMMDYYGLNLTSKYDVAVVFTMHVTNKFEKNPKSAPTTRGASANEDLPAYVYILTPVLNDDDVTVGTKLWHTKQRYGEREKSEYFELDESGKTIISHKARIVDTEYQQGRNGSGNYDSSILKLRVAYDNVSQSGSGIATQRQLATDLNVQLNTVKSWIESSNGEFIFKDNGNGGKETHERSPIIIRKQ